MVTEREYRLMKLSFIKSLEYNDKVTAIGLIGRGADASLLYFWFNLLKRNYFPTVSIMQVRADADKMSEQNPDFRESIEKWFRDYQNFVTANLYGKQNKFLHTT